jgi:hypothetical protein
MGRFGAGGESGMFAPGLDACFLVDKDDKFITFEGFTYPGALIQIEDSVGPDGECGVPGESVSLATRCGTAMLRNQPPRWLQDH